MSPSKDEFVVLPLTREQFHRVSFLHIDTLIHDPFMSVCGRFPAHPTAYGFELKTNPCSHTTWYERDVFNGYLVLTDDTFAAAPENADKPECVLVWAFDLDGMLVVRATLSEIRQTWQEQRWEVL